ncbi:MAG: hypothetical protein RLZZ469_1654 [Bacteroidota bacterium]|jgi:cytochrome b561
MMIYYLTIGILIYATLINWIDIDRLISEVIDEDDDLRNKPVSVQNKFRKCAHVFFSFLCIFLWPVGILILLGR